MFIRKSGRSKTHRPSNQIGQKPLGSLERNGTKTHHNVTVFSNALVSEVFRDPSFADAGVD
eukprot:1202477-Amphidinium_carterae.2